MRRRNLVLTMLAATTLALGAPGQFARLPGFNVGFSPAAVFAPTNYNGQPAFFMLIPGTEHIATFYNAASMPPGTLILGLTIPGWAVFESRSCAIGAGLYFDLLRAHNLSANGTVTTAGWNVFGSTAPGLWYTPADPPTPTWTLSHCRVGSCTSPCGLTHTDPDWEAYLLVPILL